ncbi:aldehyde dehydrogenase family protein [Rugosimonospora acidiphila]|uniref:Aldehyde dehydrogenase family protein n=1 Tax=Rugosimonospora acidiphila TaxID=556531 RepID=A0ABP9RQ65_9ACTN
MRDIERVLTEEWAATPADEWITKLDPADGSPVGQIPVVPPRRVVEAVQAARAAAPGWARTSPAQRAAMVHEAARAIEECADDLAWLTTREMGRPVGQAAESVAAGIGTLRQYAELGPLHRGRSLAGEWGATDLMTYQPRGVAAVITPWNDPVAVSCGLIGAALVTGNSVVYKPSERTPATGWLLGRILDGVLPPGVLTTLSGGPTVGALLTEQPVDVIAHVGSSATGRRIAQAAAVTGAALLRENGGKDPLIVDADVDPAWAAEQAATGAFANAGQLCVAVERIYVHERIAGDFLDELTKRAEQFRMGPGWDPETTLGPLVDLALRELVHDQVREAVAAGAELRCGGELPGGPGAFYPPTVLANCAEAMAVLREETFGPVAPVVTVGSFEEALRLADGGDYGLAASVLTGSVAHAQQAWRELDVGTVKVNDVFGGAPGGAAHPRRASGSGFGYGPELLDEFTTVKVVHLAPAPA